MAIHIRLTAGRKKQWFLKNKARFTGFENKFIFQK